MAPVASGLLTITSPSQEIALTLDELRWLIYAVGPAALLTTDAVPKLHIPPPAAEPDDEGAAA